MPTIDITFYKKYIKIVNNFTDFHCQGKVVLDFYLYGVLL
jgi:hypothetical protein